MFLCLRPCRRIRLFLADSFLVVCGSTLVFLGLESFFPPLLGACLSLSLDGKVGVGVIVVG